MEEFSLNRQKRNTLEMYCSFKGWRGGTIHGALEDFRLLPLKEKDRFCNRLMKAIDDKILIDIYIAKDFFNARTELE